MDEDLVSEFSFFPSNLSSGVLHGKDLNLPPWVEMSRNRDVKELKRHLQLCIFIAIKKSSNLPSALLAVNATPNSNQQYRASPIDLPSSPIVDKWPDQRFFVWNI